MNYLKQLLEFNMNQSEQQCYQGPEQSGEFQIIELNQEQIQQQNKTQLNHPKNIIASTDGQENNLLDSFKQIEELKVQNPQQSEQCAKQIQKLNEKILKQYTLIEINDQDFQNKQQQNLGSASTIKIDEYYMIVSSQQLIKKFETQQQWNNFYERVNYCHSSQTNQTMRNCSVTSSLKNQLNNQKVKICLNLKQLNSILQIKSEDQQRRQQYWNKLAVSSICIKFKYKELANKKDPQKLEKNVNKIMETLVNDIVFEILQKNYMIIENVEAELQKWKRFIIKILTLYGANDKQIGYSKGLQYIVLGILVAKPSNLHAQIQINSPQVSQSNQLLQTFIEKDQPSTIDSEFISLQKHFKYFIYTKQLRNMYFPGTPKLYEEMQRFCESMRNEVSELYKHLQQLKVDFIKLFINYYKTFLLYRVKNPEVIRKIMELLIIYGIDLVKILLTRIMNRNQKKILEMASQQLKLLKYLAESLIQDYFGNSDQADVIKNFKQLFILDIDKC